MGKKKPVVIEWRLETSASPEETWALFGDTDRYNRAVGFGFSFDETPQKDGTIQREGRATFLGIKLAWDELPFQYRVPEWYTSTRIFKGGPAERLITSLKLAPQNGGTAIHYQIAVTPRSVFTRPLVMTELNMLTRRRVDAVLKTMLSRLAGEATDADYDPLPPPLSRDAETRLLELVPRVPAPVGEKLATLIREAPLYVQDRIHPLRWSADWEVPEEQIVDSCLRAVREGMLDLHWDLLCPVCKGAKARVGRLDALEQTVHCPSCDIYYDGTFPDSLAISFRPVKAIRDFEIAVACLGSPSRQPHVVAQDRAEAGGEVKMALKLDAGAYRVRVRPPQDTVSLLVRPDATGGDAAIVAGGQLTPNRVQAAPGQVEVSIQNRSRRPLEVVLERRDVPEGVLTAGRLMERPGGRALLPDRVVAPGLDVRVARGTALAVEPMSARALAAAKAKIEAAGPRSISAGAQSVVAVWDDFPAAVEVARALSRSKDLQVAICPGPVAEVSLDGAVAPMGSTVEDALSALAGASQGYAAIPADRVLHPEIRESLTRIQGIELVKMDFALSSGVKIHWISFD